MDDKTTPVCFTLEELWLMQACVRHELPQQGDWNFPPCSLALNDAIADAIVTCEQQSIGEVAIILGRHDCLVIDYAIPNNAKSSKGTTIGKNILVKSFVARRTITLEEPELPVLEKEPYVDKQTMVENFRRKYGEA